MSLIDARHECPECGAFDGWVGERMRRDPAQARLACQCPEPPREPALSAEEMAPMEARFREREWLYL